jgi:hypothetical protein
MDKFLDIYDHPKLNQEDINYLNKSITQNEVQTAIVFRKRTIQDLTDLPLNSTRLLKKNKDQHSLNFSTKWKGIEHCLTHSMKP